MTLRAVAVFPAQQGGGGTAGSPSDTIPLMDGVGAAGVAVTASRGDHRHPSDTTKANLAGATFTGPVALAGNAAAALQAVPKQQLDAAIAGIPAGAAPSNANPVVDGTATPGSSALYARGDHVHPTDTSRLAANAAAGGDLAGAYPNPTLTLTGVTPGSYSNANITVDAKGRLLTAGNGKAGGATISDAAPTSPSVGDLWFDSVGLNTFVYYNDGNSSQWVVANSGKSALSDAPTDGGLYGRRSGTWADARVEPQVQANVGRNLLHNATFTITQRGTGPWTQAAQWYTADRWALYSSSDTYSATIASLSDADRTQIGDEAASQCLSVVVGGTSAGGAYTILRQPIEGVRRLANKTITLSFWAKASAAVSSAGVRTGQHFGSGGSPSGDVYTPTNYIALTTTWQRFTATGPLASVAGKTFGTNGDHSTFVDFVLSGGPGLVTNATINLWGVQLEIGPVATPLEKLDPADDLRHCMRFYQTGRLYHRYPTAAAGAAIGTSAPLAAAMRATPTVAQGVYNGSTNMGAITFGSTDNIVYADSTATASAATAFNVQFTASADL